MPQTMTKTITRYSSRKLYDTDESRYVLLEELADWIREGQEIHVVDKRSGADVTAQTLTQIILEEGRNGKVLPSSLLHDLVRRGEHVLHSGVEQVQAGVDRLMNASFDKVAPVRRAREEMQELRQRLGELEDSIQDLETPSRTKKTTARKTTGARKAKAKS